MKNKIKKVIAVILYISVVSVSLILIQNIIVSVHESADEARLDTAFHQQENSLDAVFLGPSTTYASWIAPYAFEKYGITVYSMASAAQPLFASKYMIEDIKITQPDALYIINVTHYLKKYEVYLANFIETYPLTLNKYRMAAYLCNLGDVSVKKIIEIFFPIIKYHNSWSELTREDLFYKIDKYKSASYYKSFLNKTRNVGSVQQNFLLKDDLTERDYKGLTDLMDYCKKERLKALFVVIPQGEKSIDRAGKQNTTVSMLEENGFDVLDLRRYVNEIGLDAGTDFYNYQHMNINGAKKITDFLSEYLIYNYGFSDKRGDSAYTDWSVAVEDYNAYLKDNMKLK